MRVFDTIRNNPIAVLGILLAGFGGCVVATLIPQNSDPESEPQPHLVNPPPQFVERFDPTKLETGRWTTSTEALPKLKPGMTRVEVEEILGPPAADALHPVTVNEGRVTYRTAYALAEPDAPLTIRPLKASVRRLPPIPREIAPQVAPTARATATAAVALEFDASKPGHPLVEIHFLDPLF